MLIDVVMPQMGESLSEGTVVRWLKKAGDRVERDEPLCEISTDKVDTDVPASTAGVLQAILVPEGQTVVVGARVAVIDDGVAGIPGSSTGTGVPAAAPPSADMAERSEEAAAHFKNAHAPQLVAFRRGRSEPSSASSAPASPTFSPAVLSAARRAGAPLHALTSLSGSGRGGRVTKADVARFLESRASAEAPSVRQQPAGERHAPSTVPPGYLYRPSPEDQLVPMSPARRKLADHMSWSVRISPHASAFTECDMTELVDFVRRERDAFADKVGAPLTITVLAASVLAKTVREFPTFNASIVEDAIAIKPRVNLGIAVALQDTDDLIVPVVRDADGLALAGMARELADLSTRARERRLRPEDVQGGTITLTNPGMFGGVTGTPILNQPQVAILGLGAIIKRAVVLEGDRIAVRSMMTLALTFDHRAADGAAAFRFLGRLKSRLEAVAGDV